MPENEVHLPPVDFAVEHARQIAAVRGQLTGGDYGEPAHGELEAGEALIEEGLGNPVAFAHTVIDWFALATGDLLHGTGEIARREHNLAFSSAALARTTCEYAGIAWWLAEPGVPVDVRIARTADLVDKSRLAARTFLDAQPFSEYERDRSLLLDWASRHRSSREKLPSPTARFVEMNPQHGKRNYAYYSLLAHGDLFITAQIIDMQLAGRPEQAVESWWRILLASAQALNLATRLSDLRDRRPDDLVNVYDQHQEYSDLFDVSSRD
jgi:hypothetical protein